MADDASILPSEERLAASFAAATPFAPLPAMADRFAWGQLSSGARGAARLAQVDRHVAACRHEPWPTLSAEAYAAFGRNGDRVGYETPYLARRRRLAWTALALAMRPEDSTTTAIWDELRHGVDLLLLETTWCLPAHAHMHPDGDLQPGAAPDPARPVVDLFASDTAAQLAELAYLAGDALDADGGQRHAAIAAAVRQRVIEPVLARDDWWWLQVTHNWNPWCAAMTMLAASHLEPDARRLARLAIRLETAVRRYIAAQPADGFCLEGPMYWTLAAPFANFFYEIVRQRSGEATPPASDPRLLAQADFLPGIHLGGDQFFWFADGKPRLALRLGLAWRFAERAASDALQRLLVAQMRDWQADGRPVQFFSDLEAAARTGAPLVHLLRDAWWLPDEPETGLAAPTSPTPITCFPSQSCIRLHDTASDTAVACKGGSTTANHGHLDCGQVVLVRAGRAILLDPGLATYDAHTFGPERPRQAWIRAEDHHVLRLDGHGPDPRPGHAAGPLQLTDNATHWQVVLDCAPAYDRALGITAYRRRLRFERDSGRLSWDDELDCPGSHALALDLLTADKPSHLDATTLLLGPAGAALRLCFDPGQWRLQLQPQPLTDAGLASIWGPTLFRIRLRGQMQDRWRSRLELLPV